MWRWSMPPSPSSCPRSRRRSTPIARRSSSGAACDHCFVVEATAKQRFLVVYDYGQGGVWAFVWARSEAEIHRAFRDLEVVDAMPSWLADEELASIEDGMTFDVDDVKPNDWIARLLRSA